MDNMLKEKEKSRIFVVLLGVLAMVLTLTLHLQPAQTKTPQNPACYMTRADGSMVILDHVCGKKKPVEGEKPPLKPPESEFISQSRGLHKILEDKNLFRGGNSEIVTFDEQLAIQRGIPQETIKLSKELVGMTNELRSLSQETGINDITAFNLDMSKYPSVAQFYENIDQNKSKSLDPASSKSFSKDKDATLKNDESSDIDEFGIALRSKESKPWWMGRDQFCGVWWNPRPSSAKKRVIFNNSNPEQLLRSWGYKSPSTPPNWVDSRLRNYAQRSGWTRPQTWNERECGQRTYRDNANPLGSSSVWEQNYDGWNPRGEPNPEVWASGPWPYNVWPAYVYWWHDRY